jgi:hypothetical protein
MLCQVFCQWDEKKNMACLVVKSARVLYVNLEPMDAEPQD